MPRIPYPDPDTLSEATRTRLTQTAPLNLLRLMSHAEVVFAQYQQMGRAILRDAVLDPHLRELAILRVGQLADSDYEKYQHIALAQQLGMDQQKIDATAVGSEAPIFNEEEAALLRFVEETYIDLRVSEEVFAAAQQHFSAAELVELSLVTGYYVMTAGFLKTFDIEIETSSPLVDSMKPFLAGGS